MITLLGDRSLLVDILSVTTKAFEFRCESLVNELLSVGCLFGEFSSIVEASNFCFS